MKKVLALAILLLSTVSVYGKEPREPYITDEPRIEITDEEVEMLAHLVKAEAGNQTFLGKQLVVDVVLNRVDCDKFPDTIQGVIHSPGQFACRGYYMKKKPSAEDYDAVYAELEERQNEEVIYFRTKRYGDGTPLFKEDAHYFSGL